MSDKMANSAYIFKIVGKQTFLRLQMRAKEMFNRHQKICPFRLFSKYKQKLPFCHTF